MFPALILRSSVDWVRHDSSLANSNPYSRCEEAIKMAQGIWDEQYGKVGAAYVEPACVSTYWSEFFHAQDPLEDENEWREGLTKRSNQYDSFDEWHEWFRKTYAKVYKDDNIWAGLLMTSWAHTHQFEVNYKEDTWEFLPATNYLPSVEMWRAEPYLDSLSKLLNEIWKEQVSLFQKMNFHVQEEPTQSLGKVECLGFDTRRYALIPPPSTKRDKEYFNLGEVVANIVFPSGDDWYRKLDNVVFANDYLDVTALYNRANYIFGSHRRILELSMLLEPEQAQLQAKLEGWHVNEEEKVIV